MIKERVQEHRLRLVIAGVVIAGIVLLLRFTGLPGTQLLRGAAGIKTTVAEVSVQDTSDLLALTAEGQASVAVRENTPSFSEEELTTDAFRQLSPLDGKGRPGPALLCAGKETFCKEKRTRLKTKPVGWHSVRYPSLGNEHLYERCHLLMYELSNLLDDKQNLMTGTRFLNKEGMQPYEKQIVEYIKRTDHHVMYRVTPVYSGEELLARGVLLEAKSVEDQGEGLSFCVYCFNVQDGIEIDYGTGESREAAVQTAPATPEVTVEYIGNKNTKKFHVAECASVRQMKDHNKVTGQTRESLIQSGYAPCANCRP